MVLMRVTPSNPTVYIVGAGGQLGTALQARSSEVPDVVVRPLTSADVDIADPTSVAAALGDLGPDDAAADADDAAARAALHDRVVRRPIRRLQFLTLVTGVLSAAALVAAALWLESVCRIPPEDEQPSEGVSA